MTTHQITGAGGIDANMAPFAFQHYAEDFFEAYTKHKGGAKFSPARLFLIARSIELAAKGLHLAKGEELSKIKNIDHDLEAACEHRILSAYGITLSPAEQAELRSANKYYKGKGFEYFLFKFPGVSDDRSGPQQALTGWPDLPDESVLEALFKKLLIPRL
jgi:hypothetical protein